MLITTNLEHEELEEQIGSRTVSRLTQICDEVDRSSATTAATAVAERA